MTPEGHKRLKEELSRLKAERPRIVREIAAAREHGDLSENAEYHAAKDRQGLTEARILELEAKLGGAEVIDTSTLSGDRVQFGATVSIVDEDTEAESTYQLVGADEADASEGRLSITSPLARALVGKSTGDSVELETPAAATPTRSPPSFTANCSSPLGAGRPPAVCRHASNGESRLTSSRTERDNQCGHAALLDRRSALDRVPRLSRAT